MAFEKLQKLLETAICQPNERIMFFVGSGISIDSGLPSFRDFSKHMIKSLTWLHSDIQGIPCCSVLDEKNIEELSRFIRPEVLMQTAHEFIGDRIFRFYEWLDSDNPNYYHYYLAAAIRCGHYVFTPNIDRLIEHAYKKLYKEEIRLIVNNSDYKSFVKNIDSQLKAPPGENPGVLFKVHGTIDNSQYGFDRYKSIRFLINQVGKGVKPYVKKTMEQCIKHCNLVFIGYSGCDHFSNQPILQDTERPKETYWLWYEDNDYAAGEKGKKLQTNELKPYTQEDIDEMWVGDGKRVKDLEIHVNGKKPYLDFTRAMEIDAAKYFLEARKNTCTVFQGNVSKFIKGIVNENKFIEESTEKDEEIRRDLPKEDDVKKVDTKQPPPLLFLTHLRLFDRYYAAAFFLWQRCSLYQAEKFTHAALEHCEHTNDFIAVRRLLADIFNAQGGLPNAKKAIEQLKKVIIECEDYLICPRVESNRDDVYKSLINAYIGIVNIVSRKRWPKEYIEKKITLTKKLIRNCQKNGGQKDFLSEEKLKLKMYEGRFLAEHKETRAESISILQQCGDAYKKKGNVRLRAYVLNALALAYYNRAEREGIGEKEKKEFLNKSIKIQEESNKLNTFIVAEWEQFRNYRNQGLAYALRATVVSGSDKKLDLDEALKCYEKAKNCFRRSAPEDFPGEKVEAKSQIAKTCQKLIEVFDVDSTEAKKYREKGLKAIYDVCEFRKEGDDHKLILALCDKFILSEDRKCRCDSCKKIVSIYNGFVQSGDKKWNQWYEKYKVCNIGDAKNLQNVAHTCDAEQCEYGIDKNDINKILIQVLALPSSL